MGDRTVLLIGDSIFDLHEGDDRLETVLGARLRRDMPEHSWTVANEAHGGEYIGPCEGTPEGVSEPLFDSETTGRYYEIVRRHPAVDVVCVCYGANDSKVYPPEGFRRRLEALSARLQHDYRGGGRVALVFSTTMYVDPAHSLGYTRTLPMVAGFRNGSSRNEYLAPYNAEIRGHAAARGYRCADLCRRIEAETAAGNWDLRLRRDGGDPREDSRHIGEMAWFDDIHPNHAGTGIVADVLLGAMRDSRR